MMLLQQHMLFQRTTCVVGATARPVSSSVARPRPVFRRTFAGKRGQFLDFEEARAYVRKLGLRRVAEWHQWSQSSAKPSFIPANPCQQYGKDAFLGFPDFLGYEKHVPAFRNQEFVSCASEQRKSSSFGMTLRACNAFLDFMHTSPSGVTLRLLHSASHIQMIYQLQNEPCNSWFPLHIRTRRALERGGQLSIAKIFSFEESGIVAWVVERNKFYYIPPEDCAELQSRISERGKMIVIPAHKLATYEISSVGEMVVKLQTQFEVGVLRISPEEMHLGHFRSAYDKLHGLLVEQIDDKLYQRCGLAMRASGLGEDTGPYNAIVSSRRVIQKAVCFATPSVGGAFRRFVLLRKGINCHRGGFPLHIDDAFDFVVVLDRARENPEVLLGAFIFPKIALGSAISSGDVVGTRCLSVYPPHMKAHYKSSVAKQAYQAQFYIDLSDPNTIDEQLTKAMAIFEASPGTPKLLEAQAGSEAPQLTGVRM